MNISRISKVLMTSTICCLPALGSMIACSPGGDITPGNAQQANQARASMTAGMAKMNTVKTEVLGVLARFQDAAPGQLLIPGLGEVKPAPISKTQVSALYGTYTETSAGVFSFAADALNPEIVVEYLNGIDITYTGFSYDAANNVKRFSMGFASNQRSINTPALEEVGGFVANTREDLADNIAGLDYYDYSLISLVFSYVDGAGVDVSYAFDFIDRISKPLFGTNPVRTADKRVVDIRGGFDNWGLNTLIGYRPTTVSGTYAATYMHRLYNDNVAGTKVGYKASVKLDWDGTSSIGAGGTVTYNPEADAGAKYTVDSVGYGVADVSGSKTCDLNTGNATGLLPAVTMLWTNLNIEAVFPGHFSCQDAVLKP